jgi:hypothetical protein
LDVDEILVDFVIFFFFYIIVHLDVNEICVDL